MTTIEKADRAIRRLSLTGNQVKKLMRKHRMPIAILSKKMGIPVYRIRQVRNAGDHVVFRSHEAADWIESITNSRRIYVLYCLRAGMYPSGKMIRD